MAARAPLPNEIISLITKHLPRDDLSQARHISKAFAAVAAPRLFETIPVWIGLHSLRALTELSQHPQLRHYVKEVAFSPLRFVDHDDQMSYLSRTKASIRLNTDSSNLADLVFMKHKGAYHAFVENQRDLTVDGLDLNILAHAFKQLPSLKRLVLDHTNTTIGAKLLHRELGFFDSSILLTCDCLYTLPVFIRALSIGKVQLECFTIGSSMAFSKRISREVSLVTWDRNHPTLSSQYPKTIAPAALAKTFDLTSQEDAYEYALFCHLHTVDIQSIKVDRTSDEEAALQMSTALTGLLGLPDILENVKIGNLGFDYRTYLNVHDVFSRIGSWVRHLDLSHMKATRSDLVDFLGEQSQRLESIKFLEVALANASWSNILAELRRFGFPDLKTFILCNCSDPEHDDEEPDWYVAAQDYVLRKTVANPCAQH